VAVLVDTNVLVYRFELWSEDFQDDRVYGTVRVVNPFRAG